MTEIAQEFSTGPGNTRNIDARRHVPGDPSMWFFVIGDLIIFGVYFVSYMYYRGQDQDMFLQGHAKLNLNIGAVNTVVLVTSSLFVALGTAAARAGKAPDALRLFSIALACGAAFPLLKLFEYIPEITAGMTPGTNLFFMYYYVMTGMHLCHVLLGLVILCFVIRNLRGPAKPRISFVETGATYWHMVDIVWLVLFALLYLMRRSREGVSSQPADIRVGIAHRGDRVVMGMADRSGYRRAQSHRGDIRHDGRRGTTPQHHDHRRRAAGRGGEGTVGDMALHGGPTRTHVAQGDYERMASRSLRALAGLLFRRSVDGRALQHILHSVARSDDGG